MKRTAKSTNPDAALLDDIKRCIALWGKVLPLDAIEEEVKNADGDPSAITARLIPLDVEIVNLERQIANTDIFTRKGYEAKRIAIRKSGLEEKDLVAVAFKLGREAGRLGIKDDPELQEPSLCWIDPSWKTHEIYAQSVQMRRRYKHREREWHALTDQ
jgi:hypothetical protein